LETKNLILSLPRSIWEIINKDLSELGNNESERIQNIVICSLSTNKDFSKYNKGYNYAEIHELMDVLEDMIFTIVKLLEEKNIITVFEWNERMGMKMQS
jgi:hypothetical protein